MLYYLHKSSPVHVNYLWELQFLVYLFRTTELSVELKSGQFKRQDRRQLVEPSLQPRENTNRLSTESDFHEHWMKSQSR